MLSLRLQMGLKAEVSNGSGLLSKKQVTGHDVGVQCVNLSSNGEL